MERFLQVHLLYGVVERILHMLSTDAVTVIKSHSSSLKKYLQELEETFYAIEPKLSDGFEYAWYIPELKKVACDIEDFLDLAATQHPKQKPRAKELSSLLSTLDKLTAKMDICETKEEFGIFTSEEKAGILKSKGKAVIRRFKEKAGISKSKEKAGIPQSKGKAVIRRSKEKAGSLPTFNFNSTTGTCYHQILPSEDIIVERKEKTEHLIQLLLSSSSSDHPNLIWVTGDPDIGKTTLVKQVLSDTRLSSFDLVLWARLSSPYGDWNANLSFLISEIIDASQSTSHQHGMDVKSMKQRLHLFLQGRKYLLVLDDYRKLDPSMFKDKIWYELSDSLKAGSTGSTVIVVSSSPLLFFMDGSRKIFKVEGMSEDECWSLFKICAGLDEAEQQVDPSLEHVGRSIATKLCQSPGTIKTLAGLLRSNRDIGLWKRIDEDSLRHPNSVMNALLLILYQVPSRLIQSYATFCIFGKGKDIVSKDELIYFWMAQGLLQSTDENEDLRDIGNRLCNELLWRNLLQLHPVYGLHHQCFLAPCFKRGVELPHDYSITGYPLPWILAWDGVENAEEEFESFSFWMENRSPLWFSKVRVLLMNAMGSIREPFWVSIRKSFLDLLFSRATPCLRVLLLNQFEFEKLPDKIGESKLLRYLSLAGNNKLQVLPDTICELVNLQTLDLSGCIQLQKFPQHMHRLQCLRHLHLSLKLTSLPKEVLNSWTSLHLLKICNCQHLNSLPQGMGNLTALQTLQIHDCPSIASLPNSIKFLTNLKELSIVNCQILDLTGWEGLLDLRSLKFLQFQGLPKLWEFPDGLQSAAHSLEHLVISSCTNLRMLPESFGHCTSLLVLIIESNPNLPSLPQNTQALRNLQVLKILHCPNLAQRCQEEIGEHWHLISHIPIVYLQDKVIRNRSTSTWIGHPGEGHSEITSASDPSASKFPPSPADTGADTNDERLQILSLFRNGYEFEKDMLIQLWIAEGFIKNEPMEMNGAKYFDKLVSKGYISCSSSNSLYYKVNIEKADSDFCTLRDKQNYLLLGSRSQNDAESAETLHVSVVCDDIDEKVFKTLRRFKGLRTLLFLGKNGCRLQQVPRDLFLSCEFLAALDLSGSHIEELPSSAVKMVHLRYLDLSWTLIELLPERIDRFQCLQTLKLKGCSHLLRLPKNMKSLIELRHLDLDIISQLNDMPEGMGALINLQTLSAFLVGTEEGFKIRELKNLNNITREFCIARLEHVQSADEAQEGSLQNKRNLKKLELRWSNCQIPESKDKDESVLAKLCPWSGLEEIKIVCYSGATLPGWIVSFYKLIRISLSKCENISMLPPLGMLPSLQSLELIRLNSVTRMDCRGEINHVAFSKLQKLVVDVMLNLETWAEAKKGDYPCLVELMIKDCPKLSELPSLLYLPSLKQLEVSGCAKVALVSAKALSASLQTLIVEDCPLIEESCLEQGSQDWHKIEHVPNIWIDQRAIQTCEDQRAIQTCEDDNDVLVEDDDES